MKRPASIVGTTAHSNHMAGTSYDIGDPICRLRIAAASCFFGEPAYYSRAVGQYSYNHNAVCNANAAQRAFGQALIAPPPHGTSVASVLERAIDDAIAHDADLALQCAAQLRTEDMIRTTPQVILVRAAHHAAARGTGIIRKWAPLIVQRADEPAVGLAYSLAAFPDRPLPNSLKRAWRGALEAQDELHLAKYRADGHTVKLVDVINLTHPRTEACALAAQGKLRLAPGDTWEAMLSERGSTSEAWAEAVSVMGHMALLRNLRNLIQHGVDPSTFCDRLVRTAAYGKQLPFRYFAAREALIKSGCANARVLDALEGAALASLGALPRISGKLVALCDNSGSAHGAFTSEQGTTSMASIANLTGVILAKLADEGDVRAFGDVLEGFDVQRTMPILHDHERLNKIGERVGNGTENGVWQFYERALRTQERYDAIVILSDMQAGHGGLYGLNEREYSAYSINGRYIDVAALHSAYLRTVNANAKLFCVQVAGYTDTLVPEAYPNAHIIGGWSPGVVRYIAQACQP